MKYVLLILSIKLPMCTYLPNRLFILKNLLVLLDIIFVIIQHSLYNNLYSSSPIKNKKYSSQFKKTVLLLLLYKDSFTACNHHLIDKRLK